MEKIIIGLLYLYGASAAIAALYFNYLFAVEKGFMAWLLFGEIIATLQGLIWPLYYFQIL
ncbi:MAG: hypothetical protein CMJ11_07945 [Pelagibacterales bacterium]|nr:hypothetical protein [Pelagibacterales bacterium]|tara:strand:- start:849 stop:1028 length:180 start_codon:yes stop_codon:yes gene_type:complete